MKKVMILNFLAIFLSISISSCEKVDFPKDTPTCIKKEIRKQQDECLDRVVKYEYNGNTVYLFEPADCPDALFNLYDENCNHICSPAGGISGNGDGKCNDFYQAAIEKEVIWTKN